MSCWVCLCEQLGMLVSHVICVRLSPKNWVWVFFQTLDFRARTWNLLGQILGLGIFWDRYWDLESVGTEIGTWTWACRLLDNRDNP